MLNILSLLILMYWALNLLIDTVHLKGRSLKEDRDRQNWSILIEFAPINWYCLNPLYLSIANFVRAKSYMYSHILLQMYSYCCICEVEEERMKESLLSALICMILMMCGCIKGTAHLVYAIQHCIDWKSAVFPPF